MSSRYFGDTQSQLVIVDDCSLFCPPFQSISVLFLAINPHDSTEVGAELPTLRSPSGRSGDPKSSKPGALAAPEIQHKGIKAIPAIFGIIVVIQIPSRYTADAKSDVYIL